MSKVVVRTLTGLTIGLVAAGTLWMNERVGGGVVSLYVGLLLGIISVIELGRMFKDSAVILVGMGALLMARARFEALTEFGADAIARELGYVFGFACLVAVFVAVLKRYLGHGGLRAWSRPLYATWIAFPLVGLVPFAIQFGTRGLIALIVLSKVGDIAGYFVGRAIGKRHPFPGISPNKTWAGCNASLAVGALAGAGMAASGYLHTGTLEGLILGATTNLLAQAGDLFESSVKRHAGVKDSSNLMGASGGMLDVVDSLLFTVPFALFIWPLFLIA